LSFFSQNAKPNRHRWISEAPKAFQKNFSLISAFFRDKNIFFSYFIEARDSFLVK
jgi:hypothetical protein